MAQKGWLDRIQAGLKKLNKLADGMMSMVDKIPRYDQKPKKSVKGPSPMDNVARDYTFNYIYLGDPDNNGF